MKLWPHSLQGQLALRLGLVFFLVSAAGVGLLLWEGSEAADSFGLEMLHYRAEELARHVVRSPDGRAAFKPTAAMARVYDSQKGENLYAIRTDSGQVLTNNREFPGLVSRAQAEEGSSNFRLEEFGPRQDDYYGMTVTESSAAGPVNVAVAHSSDADAIAVGMLKFFARRIAWMIPLFALVMLVIGAWSVRAGLRPLAAISRRAAEIDPRAADVRLPIERLPSELLPLVQAVNSAFDRLQEGFAVQRRFTANAAHELRTPLTMLTAGLDELNHGAPVTKLKADVARMNRLVSQLLRVARLDAMPMNVSARVDLAQVAAQVVEYLAPWAIAHQRTIAFDGPDHPVMVKGNADEISDAIRNIVENAVLHTPPDTEVTVGVASDGSVTVDDWGAGVPREDRAKIFDRFWRGKVANAPGAGLGLAIVSEIVRHHGGTVEVGDAPRGGASFRLHFRQA